MSDFAVIMYFVERGNITLLMYSKFHFIGIYYLNITNYILQYSHIEEI